MNKTIQILGIIVTLTLFVLVRYFQEQLFFDPYLAFFKNQVAFENTAINEKNYEIMISVGYRYLLNGILSLVLIYLIFKNSAYVFSSFFMLFLFFVILFPIYCYFVMVDFREYTLIGFYVRRFMIQPILAMLLIPAFYYLGRKKT